MEITDMTNLETAAHIREYAKKKHGAFHWCTDACGYKQHMRFVKHRNNNWHGGDYEAWKKFMLDYADMREQEGEADEPVEEGE